METNGFDENFVSKLPQDVNLALEKIGAEYFRALESAAEGKKVAVNLHAYAFLCAYAEANKAKATINTNISLDSPPQITANVWHLFARVYEEAKRNNIKSSVEKDKQRFVALLNKRKMYEFTEGDLSRLQQLLNELRDAIRNTAALEEEHKDRLLRKLETLQSELHKKVSDLDRFWGLIVDTQVVLVKLGKAALPIAICIKKIAEIVWTTQAHGEELPSGTTLPFSDEKLLQDPDTSTDGLEQA